MWQVFLAAIYTTNLTPYDVKYGFFDTFGPDPNWWLTIIIAFAILVVLELAFKSMTNDLVKAGKWPRWKEWAGIQSTCLQDTELGIWQEMEKDPVVRRRLAVLAADGDKVDEDDECSQIETT